MEKWVALRPLFEVCVVGKEYEGGGNRRDVWWRQEAIEKQLQANLAGVSREYKRSRGLIDRESRGRRQREVVLKNGKSEF